MKTYTFTLTHCNAVESKTFAAILSDAEYTAIKADLHKARYSCRVSPGVPVDNAESNYKELVRWLATTTLFSKTKVRIILSSDVIPLPDGIYLNTNDTLEVISGKEFTSMTTEDCMDELERCIWILSEFPGATYNKSRVKFSLPTKDEKGNHIHYTRSYKDGVYYLHKEVVDVDYILVEI